MSKREKDKKREKGIVKALDNLAILYTEKNYFVMDYSAEHLIVMRREVACHLLSLDKVFNRTYVSPLIKEQMLNKLKLIGDILKRWTHFNLNTIEHGSVNSEVSIFLKHREPKPEAQASTDAFNGNTS
jgi:hypothetical protein